MSSPQFNLTYRQKSSFGHGYVFDRQAEALEGAGYAYGALSLVKGSPPDCCRYFDLGDVAGKHNVRLRARAPSR